MAYLMNTYIIMAALLLLLLSLTLSSTILKMQLKIICDDLYSISSHSNSQFQFFQQLLLYDDYDTFFFTFYFSFGLVPFYWLLFYFLFISSNCLLSFTFFSLHTQAYMAHSLSFYIYVFKSCIFKFYALLYVLLLSFLSYF